ncbi:uncharacterized protein LOC128247653 [Octopus bimaculoides]|uniref:uncharacterized protein LOC128247653 n=1 Tax=Octopus bimaculoides TaxID=37653 RepID=UPI0022E15169|nr:uncharacterized protein LOC128247653 [Octopus bimaculoides]
MSTSYAVKELITSYRIDFEWGDRKWALNIPTSLFILMWYKYPAAQKIDFCNNKQNASGNHEIDENRIGKLKRWLAENHKYHRLIKQLYFSNESEINSDKNTPKTVLNKTFTTTATKNNQKYAKRALEQPRVLEQPSNVPIYSYKVVETEVKDGKSIFLVIELVLEVIFFIIEIVSILLKES